MTERNIAAQREGHSVDAYFDLYASDNSSVSDEDTSRLSVLDTWHLQSLEVPIY